MSAIAHPWRTGKGGRSFRTVQGGIMARAACSVIGCEASHEIKFRLLADGDIMDQKFEQAGWKMRPLRCPHHAAKRKEPAVASSPEAMRAQFNVFRLLTDHFDTDAGAYATGWDDAKVAKDTGIATSAVVAYREAGFGPLKEPPELKAIADEIGALESIMAETFATFTADIAAIKDRLTEARKKFPA